MMLLRMNLNENMPWFETYLSCLTNYLVFEKKSRPMTLTFSKIESHTDGTD